MKINFLNKKQNGFTFIELMIVVAIIGILVAISISNFQIFLFKSRSVEARSNLSSIKICEESYRSEYGTYLVCAPHPSSVPGVLKRSWEDPVDFATIGFVSLGKVYYQYEVRAGAETIATSYLASATGDLDGSGFGSQGVFTIDQAGVFMDTNPGIW